MEPTRTQELLLLGEIKGIVQGLKEGQDAQAKRMDDMQAHNDRRMDALQASVNGLDGRLRTVEQKSAVIGAVSGGAMSIGVALIIEGLKQWATSRGGN